ncbi:MAG: class I SAM-dependent methyltransferase [Actinomycetota bacterium]
MARGLQAARTTLRGRYADADLAVFDEEERRRFLAPGALSEAALAWELLYRLEPELYDRLIAAEPLHPGILDWLPQRPARVVEVAAGTGRLTLHLAHRCRELIAIEPAAPLRGLLEAKLRGAGCSARVRVVRGFFDALPVEDGWADLVVACSALTAEAGHGGDEGLAEMERVTAPGGRIVIVWPADARWLARRGYRHRTFAGEMHMAFPSLDDAVALAEIFYPHAVAEIRRRGEAVVPYDLLGMRPPRDLAYRRIKPRSED